MGSKLHQLNKLFATLRKNDCKVANTGVKTSMERLSEYHGRDSLRNTMLKHEEMFRQQVRELHRLYRVQKILMSELSKTKPGSAQSESAATTTTTIDTRTRNWNSVSTSDTSHSSHVSNAIHFARDKGFDLDRPAGEFTPKWEKSHRLVHEMWPHDASEVELTLSIGCGKEHASSSSPKVDIGPENREDSNGSSSDFDRKRRLKSPPWLLQGLNLNKT